MSTAISRTIRFGLVPAIIGLAILAISTRITFADNTPTTGSITVCKVLVDATGAPITGVAGSNFSITLSLGSASHVASFDTPLTLDSKILNSEVNNGQCKAFTGLELGTWNYGEEAITSSLSFESPLYSDQVDGQAYSVSDLFTYNQENNRDNADGHVVLLQDVKDRTLIVYNKLKAPACNPTASQTIVSDTATLMGTNPTVPVSPIHPAWTASIAGATWVWGENPIADAVATTTETFTRTFTVVGTPTGATLDIATDNSYTVSVNGHAVAADATEFNFTLAGQDNSIAIPAGDLLSGTNTVTFMVTNFAMLGGTMASNPAGLLYKLVVNSNECVTPPPSCPDGQHFNSDHQCVPDVPTCTDGQHLNSDNQCVPNVPTCTEGQHLNSDNQCVADVPTCTADQHLVENQCVANTPTCGEGQHLNSDNQCVTNGGGGGGGGSDNSGGSHGGGNGPIAGSLGGFGGHVLGASTSTVSGGPSCSVLLHTFMRRGGHNDSEEVKKLQQFLNTQLHLHLVITGVFDAPTIAAVNLFQTTYAAQILTPWGLTSPTGFVYKTTQRWINLLNCATLTIPMPDLSS